MKRAKRITVEANVTPFHRERAARLAGSLAKCLRHLPRSLWPQIAEDAAALVGSVEPCRDRCCASAPAAAERVLH